MVQDSRCICVEEKMSMFLMTLSHNTRSRIVKRRFNHSLQMIHFYLHEVLRAMMKFSREVIGPPSYHIDPNQITSYRRLREAFKGAVGALDGTLVHAVIPTKMQVPYRGRGRGSAIK